MKLKDLENLTELELLQRITLSHIESEKKLSAISGILTFFLILSLLVISGILVYLLYAGFIQSGVGILFGIIVLFGVVFLATREN